jgi:prohibitin 1
LKEHGSALVEVRRIDSLKDIALTLAKCKNVTYAPLKGNFLYNVPTPLIN